jgi:hypothetical protein
MTSLRRAVTPVFSRYSSGVVSPGRSAAIVLIQLLVGPSEMSWVSCLSHGAVGVFSDLPKQLQQLH